MPKHHVNAATCEACEDKLARVHPALARWVRMVRSKHPDAHISCGYRSEAEQEAAFKAGTTHAHYPHSAHNSLPARAVDFFRQTQAGGAAFDAPWYRDVIHLLAVAAGLVAGVQYKGADGKMRQDMPHVEMPQDGSA